MTVPGVPPRHGHIGVLQEPRWLLDGYARTENLASTTDEDFRLVISAVLGVDRHLWDATDGFDESFVGYGGEDWDFGWRAWLAGATGHMSRTRWPGTTGPTPAARETDLGVKNAESLRLAMTIPLPSVRGSGLIHDQPDIVVSYLGPTDRDGQRRRGRRVCRRSAGNS